MAARERLAQWMTWRGWTQPALAAHCGCSQGKISQLLLGKQGVGLTLAHAIERVTSEPRPSDGAVWPEGPIRTEEWVEAGHSSTVTADTTGGE